jgi:hypothetical protein
MLILCGLPIGDSNVMVMWMVYAGSDDKRCEALIQQTLLGVLLTAMHPRTQITVVLQVRS